MDKERYTKFKALMEAVKDIHYVGVEISDYLGYFRVTITLEEEK